MSEISLVRDVIGVKCKSSIKLECRHVFLRPLAVPIARIEQQTCAGKHLSFRCGRGRDCSFVRLDITVSMGFPEFDPLQCAEKIVKLNIFEAFMDFLC